MHKEKKLIIKETHSWVSLMNNISQVVFLLLNIFDNSAVENRGQLCWIEMNLSVLNVSSREKIGEFCDSVRPKRSNDKSEGGW